MADRLFVPSRRCDKSVCMSAPPERPRWRFRFSLRTLLLAALFSGSAMLLWHNRAPWQVWRTITETAPIFKADFSPHGTYFYTSTLVTSGEHGLISEVIRIYETETGRLQTTIKSAYEFQGRDTRIYFSPGERYLLRMTFYSDEPRTRGMGAATCEMWAADDGRRLFPWNSWGAKSWPEGFSSNDSLELLGTYADCISLVRLPSFETIQVLPPLDPYEQALSISPDEKWLIYPDVSRKGSLVLASTAPGATEKRYYPSSSARSLFSPDSRLLAVAWPLTLAQPSLEQTWVVDVQTGRTVAEFDGGIEGMCFSDDSQYIATVDKTKHEAVVWHIEPKKECLRFKADADSRVRIIGQRVFNHFPVECYDLAAGAKIWGDGDRFGGQVTDDGAYIVNNPYLHFAGNEWPTRLNSEFLISAKTGKIAHRFELPTHDEIAKYFHWSFAAKQRRMLSLFETNDVNAKDPRNFQLQLWQNRRPEEWWGCAWLWEFWLMAALGMALIWSVFRSEYSLQAVRMQPAR